MSASLTFRGFDVDPQTVQDWIGAPATGLGVKGQPVKPGVETKLTRSYAEFSVSFERTDEVFTMIPALLNHMGGLDHVVDIKQRLSAEFIDVNLVLPFKRYLRQTNGWIDQESIGALNRIGAILAFEIL